MHGCFLAEKWTCLDMWDNVSRHFILLVCHIQISKTMRPGKCIIEEEVKSWGTPEKGIIKVFFQSWQVMKKKGVYMLMNGVPASPMQIVQAHIVREDAVYMRDYVLNDNGDIKELCFDDVEMQEQDR